LHRECSKRKEEMEKKFKKETTEKEFQKNRLKQYWLQNKRRRIVKMNVSSIKITSEIQKK
jgi:hypothetical protein